MTLRPADTRRAAVSRRQRSVIVALVAIVVSAVMALAALGIGGRQTADNRLAAQTVADAAAIAQTIFDRDRQLLSHMIDAKATGLSDDTALSALPPGMRAVLLDPVGVPLASAPPGLDTGRLILLGDAIARHAALHPYAAFVVVPATGDARVPLAALARPWFGADGTPGGIAVVAFDRDAFAGLEGLTSARIEVVASDGTPLFGSAAKSAATGERLEAKIPGMPLMLLYSPAPASPERMPRAVGPFALISVVGLAAALGLAFLLARSDRAMRREIERLASIERELGNKLQTSVGAAERADESTRTKSRFFAQVTHELRTPLNAIIGFSEAIRQQMFGPVSNPRYLEYAGLIHDAGTHLLSLINDLLDNARVEAGKIEVAPMRVSAAAVARSALDLVELLAEQHKVALTATGFGNCPDLNVDPRAIKQVLVNLLSNAIKYTPAGGRIEMRFTERPEGGVAIEVADTGTGMTAEEVLYAFEPFGRAGTGHMRRQPGTGLGLSLARSLVRLHGGDLTLASRLDMGTTATVTLPASAAFAAPGAKKIDEEAAPQAA